MSKYPAAYDFTARVALACQILKDLDAEYFADVIFAFQRAELHGRKGKRTARKQQKVYVASRNGAKPTRGSRAYVNLANPDIQIVPSQQTGKMEW